MESYKLNENQKKVYTYRKHLFFIAKIIPFVAVLSIIFVIFSVVYINNILVTILFSIVTIEMIFMHFFYKRFTSMKLLVDETGIHFRNVQKHVDIAYQDKGIIKETLKLWWMDYSYIQYGRKNNIDHRDEGYGGFHQTFA